MPNVGKSRLSYKEIRLSRDNGIFMYIIETVSSLYESQTINLNSWSFINVTFRIERQGNGINGFSGLSTYPEIKIYAS